MIRARVLQVCHDSEGPFVDICAQFVEALPHALVTTVFLCGQPDNAVAERVGGDVRFLGLQSPQLRSLKLSAIRHVRHILASTGADCIIAHRYKPYWCALWASHRTNITVLLVAHEHGVLKRLSRRLVWRLFRNRSVLAGVSRSVCDDLAEATAEPVPDSLPLVVREADRARLLTRGAARTELGLDAKAFVIGAVGRLNHKKRLDVLLRGFARSERTEPETVLVIVGDGPLRESLESLAASLELGPSVRFAGHVEEAARLFRAFDVFVFPSGKAEAFGRVLLEAMIAGVPVISADSPGPREVVGDAGTLFPDGDAGALANRLAELTSMDPVAREAAVARGITRVAELYSLEVLESRLSRLLTGIG